MLTAGDGPVLDVDGHSMVLPSFWQGMAAFAGIGPFAAMLTAPPDIQETFYELVLTTHGTSLADSLEDYAGKAMRIRTIMEENETSLTVDAFRETVTRIGLYEAIDRLAVHVTVPVPLGWNRATLIEEIANAILVSLTPEMHSVAGTPLVALTLECEDSELWSDSMVDTLLSAIQADILELVVLVSLVRGTFEKWFINPSVDVEGVLQLDARVHRGIY